MRNILMTDAIARRQRQSGFSLLEVLIALVILSVGLLGIAAMISTSLKTNDSAYMRTQATTLAYNIIDRMRANRTTAQDSSFPYNVSMPFTPPPSPTTTCDGSGASCSGTALATFDLTQWEYDVSTVLPQGQGGIVTATSGGVTTVTVTVQWNASRVANGLKATSAPAVTTYAYVVVSSAL
ncbi:MAG: type IV pilus modification protein PilV [Gammaproteobacteria bacterium]